jgi:F0F1-type ATP synthase epsilon subunit
VSERELNRLRDFYHGLTDELGRVRQHAEEANKVSEGLMHLCQDHLTILADLEQQNADLRRENRNIREKLNQQLKEDDRCKTLLSA